MVVVMGGGWKEVNSWWRGGGSLMLSCPAED